MIIENRNIFFIFNIYLQLVLIYKNTILHCKTLEKTVHPDILCNTKYIAVTLCIKFELYKKYISINQ